MRAAKKSSAMTRCLIEVSKLDLESFRLPTDGRKWKSVARSRQSLLNYLARHANPDGTFVNHGINYSLGEKRMMTHLGFSDTWIEKLLDDLHGLGLLCWERPNRQHQRTYQITVPGDGTSLTPTIQNPDAKYSPSLTPSIQNLMPSIRAKMPS